MFSSRVQVLSETLAPLHRFLKESTWAQCKDFSEACDFTFGNPQEMPLNGYVEALQKSVIPITPDWFAYKQNVPEAQALISTDLSQRLRHPFEADDICMTNGAIAGLQVVLSTIIEAGDEVIFISPHWFLYEGLIINAGGQPVQVSVDLGSFNLNLEAIEDALCERTRAVIINSPHNPTGKIYSHQTLTALRQLLDRARELYGTTIYIISDEAYHQIVFDSTEFVSPATIYPDTFLIYTYGKVLLTPGQRIGFIALPGTMSNRVEIRTALNLMQTFLGWAFPNALLQYAAEDLVSLSIDIDQLQQKRDLLLHTLGTMGYVVVPPDGTFYLLVKSPIEDDWEWVERLALHRVFCFPGSAFGLPGYFRLSLTASDEMIERSLPIFQTLLQAA